jgi:uncharacterized protein
MKFWDASAIVPLLVAELTHESLMQILREDPVVLVWWGTPTECVSALARREREGLLPEGIASDAYERLATLSTQWSEILPSNAVRTIAERILRTHVLRAADSLQLAAAIVAAEQQPRALEFLTLDRILARAAVREGFIVRDVV